MIRNASNFFRWAVHRQAIVFLLALPAIGCLGHARVELAAADVVDELSQSLAAALNEYHADMTAADDARERAVAEALVQRIRRDSDEPAAGTHVEAFLTAMERIRDDRRTAGLRYTVSHDNLAALSEVSSGLRRMALDSMALSDEARRYLGELLDQWKAIRTAPAGN